MTSILSGRSGQSGDPLLNLAGGSGVEAAMVQRVNPGSSSYWCALRSPTASVYRDSVPTAKGRGVATGLITALLSEADPNLVLDVLAVNHRVSALYRPEPSDETPAPA